MNPIPGTIFNFMERYSEHQHSFGDIPKLCWWL